MTLKSINGVVYLHSLHLLALAKIGDSCIRLKGLIMSHVFIMVIDLLAEVDHDTQMEPLWLTARFFSFFFWDKRQHASTKAQEAVDHLASFLSVREETSQLRIEPPLLPIFKCANRCTS